MEIRNLLHTTMFCCAATSAKIKTQQKQKKPEPILRTTILTRYVKNRNCPFDVLSSKRQSDNITIIIFVYITYHVLIDGRTAGDC